MLYVIIGRDGPNAKELRPRLRPRHLEHLGAYDREGRVVLAGPLTDGYGSLIVLEAETLADVEEIMRQDPYVVDGVFESFSVHPFLKVFPGDHA